MSKKTISQIIGNVKKNYSTEDFNPFAAISYIYDYCITDGVGSTIAIVGHTPRFKSQMVKAWQHLMFSRKLIVGDTPPWPDRLGRFETHTGAIIHFIGINDRHDNVQRINTTLKENQAIVFCSPYHNPGIKCAIHFATNSKKLMDVSRNNLPKVVDFEN